MSATQRLKTGRSSQFADSAGGGGALQVVEHHDFPIDATGYTFSGLNGDADLIYVLEHYLITATVSDTSFLFRPNGVSSNLSGAFSFAIPSTGGFGAISDWAISHINGGAIGDVSVGSHKVFCKTGAVRLAQGHQSDWQTGTGIIEVSQTFAWNEKVTNITSFDLISNVTNGIKAGSYATLYKLLQS